MFACKKEKLRTATDTDRKREMVAILHDVANQGRYLFPTENLLRQLLNPVYLEKIICNPPTPSKPATATDLVNWLANAAALGKKEESFEPFTLGTGRYIVKGLNSVQVFLDNGDTAAFETHVRGIMESKADLVVNLIHPAEKKNYLASPLLTLQPTEHNPTTLYKFENGKLLYNFIDWPDGGWVTDGKEEALLCLVRSVAKQVNDGMTVFVHCQNGDARTAVFLALVELVRKKGTIQDLSEANLHNELFKILLEITKFEKSRFPTTEQLERLMTCEFLRKLVS
jgi:protein-tyrosine phosphatase